MGTINLFPLPNAKIVFRMYTGKKLIIESFFLKKIKVKMSNITHMSNAS